MQSEPNDVDSMDDDVDVVQDTIPPMVDFGDMEFEYPDDDDHADSTMISDDQDNEEDHAQFPVSPSSFRHRGQHLVDSEQLQKIREQLGISDPEPGRDANDDDKQQSPAPPTFAGPKTPQQILSEFRTKMSTLHSFDPHGICDGDKVHLHFEGLKDTISPQTPCTLLPSKVHSPHCPTRYCMRY